MTETPQKNNTMRNILIGGCIVVLACVICAGAAFALTGGAILGLVQGPTLYGTAFMEALKTKDYATAWTLVHPDQQQALGGSAEGLQQTVEGVGLGNVSAYTFKSVNVVNNQGVVTFTATVDGAARDVAVNMQQDGQLWKVIGFGAP